METGHGLVSIIMPSYNSSKYIAESIDSIIAQSYTNWELLITDDCSTDNTCEIVKRYATRDNRIRLFTLEKNSGSGVARNKSIKEAKGRYIAFCDSDDRWLPDKLELQVELMQQAGAEICYGSYLTCDENNVNTGIVVAYKQITYKEICRDDSIGFLTCMYDTRRLGKVYMPELRKRQDWGWKIKLMKHCSVAYGIIKPLAIYRIRKGSLSNNKRKLIRYNVKIYHDVLGLPSWLAWLKFLFQFIPWHIAKCIRIKIINQ